MTCSVRNHTLVLFWTVNPWHMVFKILVSFQKVYYTCICKKKFQNQEPKKITNNENKVHSVTSIENPLVRSLFRYTGQSWLFIPISDSISDNKIFKKVSCCAYLKEWANYNIRLCMICILCEVSLLRHVVLSLHKVRTYLQIWVENLLDICLS